MKKDEKFYNNEWVRGIAAALGIGGGLYALLRAPIHGSPIFKDLRAQHGSNMTIKSVISEKTPFWKKILNPYDKSIEPSSITDAAFGKTPFPKKGLNIDNTLTTDPLTTVGGETFVIDPATGGSLSLFNIIKQRPASIHTFYRKGLNDLLPDIELEKMTTNEDVLSLVKKYPNHVFKPQIESRGANAKLYTSEILQNDPLMRKSLLEEAANSLVEKRVGIQPYIKGEEFRMTFVGDKVVPNATTTRHGNLSEGIRDLLSPSRKRKMKNLETFIQSKLDNSPKWKDFVVPKKGPKHLYGPDVISSFDDKGNVLSASIIDMNSPTLGHLTYQNNPIASAKFYKQITGRYPKNISLLASGLAGTGAGTGTYFISRKKRETA